MKRFFTMGAMALLFCLFINPAAGAAESDVTLSATCVPKAIPGPGKVVIEVRVSCRDNAPYRLDQVKLYKGEAIVAQIAQIQPSDSKVLSGIVQISSAEVGGDIPLKLTWSENGTAHSKAFTVAVGQGNYTPNADFTRTFNDVDAQATGTAKMTYTLKNNGEGFLTDLKITDFGTTVASQDELYPGSVASFTYNQKVTAGLKSEPTLTYTCYGKQYTKKLDAVAVSVKNEKVEIALEASKTLAKTNEKVTVTCTIKNSGDVDYTSLSVTDSKTGERIYTATSLSAGTTRSFTWDYTITADLPVKYKVELKDSKGNTTTLESATLDIAMEKQAPAIQLEITAQADKTMAAPGDTVVFTITVSNKGEATAEKLLITDANQVVVASLDTLPMGSKTITHSQTINEAATYTFTLTCGLDTPDEVRVSAAPIAISLAAQATPPPDASPDPSGFTPAPTVTAQPKPAGRITGILVGIGIGIIILLGLIVTFAVMLMRQNTRLGGKRKRR